MNKFPVRFKEWDCFAVPGLYGNGRLAVQLVFDQGPLAVATINLPDEPLGTDFVFIKNYSENEGMVDALVLAKVIEPRARYTVRRNFVEIGAYQLTDEFVAALAEEAA